MFKFLFNNKSRDKINSLKFDIRLGNLFLNLQNKIIDVILEIENKKNNLSKDDFRKLNDVLDRILSKENKINEIISDKLIIDNYKNLDKIKTQLINLFSFTKKLKDVIKNSDAFEIQDGILKNLEKTNFEKNLQEIIKSQKYSFKNINLEHKSLNFSLSKAFIIILIPAILLGEIIKDTISKVQTDSSFQVKLKTELLDYVKNCDLEYNVVKYEDSPLLYIERNKYTYSGETFENLSKIYNLLSESKLLDSQDYLDLVKEPFEIMKKEVLTRLKNSFSSEHFEISEYPKFEKIAREILENDSNYTKLNSKEQQRELIKKIKETAKNNKVLPVSLCGAIGVTGPIFIKIISDRLEIENYSFRETNREFGDIMITISLQGDIIVTVYKKNSKSINGEDSESSSHISYMITPKHFPELEAYRLSILEKYNKLLN
ncbi:MAG: hypothetical protein AB7V77_00535 [Candidatus Woesearchaeota archaeon]